MYVCCRQRKDELEQRMSSLQESRRELMVQLEGLMKLLKVTIDGILLKMFPKVSFVPFVPLEFHCLSSAFLVTSLMCLQTLLFPLTISNPFLRNLSSFSHLSIPGWGTTAGSKFSYLLYVLSESFSVLKCYVLILCDLLPFLGAGSRLFSCFSCSSVSSSGPLRKHRVSSGSHVPYTGLARWSWWWRPRSFCPRLERQQQYSAIVWSNFMFFLVAYHCDYILASHLYLCISYIQYQHGTVSLAIYYNCHGFLLISASQAQEGTWGMTF